MAPAVRWAKRPRLPHGSAAWDYLATIRRLPVPVLTEAARLEAVWEGFKGSIWFTHRQDDRGSHVEVRGPEFRGLRRGGAKPLFRFSAARDGRATRLALAEAPIGALSLAALEHLRPDTIYAATGGGMGDGTIAAITQALAGLGRSTAPELASAADANDAGKRYVTRHAGLARSSRIPFVRPTAIVEADWNDVLQERAAWPDMPECCCPRDANSTSWPRTRAPGQTGEGASTMSDDRAGMDMAGQPDPEAVRRVAYEGLWPGGRPFPLTPLDAWRNVSTTLVLPGVGI